MWKINKDYLTPKLQDVADIPSRVGVSGGKTNLPWLAPLIEFRLKDDDGEVYYGGILQDDREGMNQFMALEYGQHDAGCTIIEVKRNGKWVQEIG